MFLFFSLLLADLSRLTFPFLRQTIFFALILGFIWLREGRDVKDKSQSVQSIAGALFFILVNQSFSEWS